MNKTHISRPRVILLDVGNTSISYGVYEGSRMVRKGSVIHSKIPSFVSILFKKGLNNENHVLISSVVPKLTQILKKRLKTQKGVKFWILGEDLKLRISHNYKNFKQLGSDRALIAYGAHKIYKGPLILADFGTALVMDYVTAKGDFRGGLIIPGPEISFQSLIERAAQIPGSLRLPRKSKEFLGRSTLDCIRSGILQGYGAMVDELIRRFKRETDAQARCVLTGGFAHHLAPYIKEKHLFDPDLPIKSLLLLYKDKCR